MKRSSEVRSRGLRDRADAYDVVPYEEGYEDEVVEFLRPLWSADVEVNRRHLHWKYLENPWLRRPLLFVARERERGRIVGTRGMYGARWTTDAGSAEIDAPCGSDVLIAPEHRKSGLNIRLAESAQRAALARGHRVLLITSASRVMRLVSLGSGWRFAGAPSLAVRGARTPSLRQSFAALDAPRARWFRKRPPAVTVEREADAAAMAELTSRLPAEPRIRHVRDQSYFAWRYGNPLADYRFVSWRERRLEGYVVLHRHRYGDQKRVHVVDWAFGDREVGEALLERVGDIGSSDLVVMRRFERDPDHALFGRAGFVTSAPARGATRSKQSILVLLLQNADGSVGERSLLRLEDWACSLIDSDNY